MDAERPDDTRSEENFAALWSSDGLTRSLAPTATGVPADLPFLFSGGQRFGPYLIVRPIGKGGMGQVYEAEETDSGRRVAVKILSRGIGDDEERARFLQEGRLAASLSHPNTVYVFGTTEVQGFPVIAMELAPSGTLKDLVVPGRPMTTTQAADAILQVIDGLEAAAALGILHRDIKPSNCFVAAGGRVLVGDFGLSITTLARAGDTGDAPGTILGTPGFASPEQLRGGALDVRSDIYSIGATIYYLLTAKAPFDDPDLRTMMTRVATEAPPALSIARPDIPSRLGSVVAKCLATKAGDRYANYAALRSALEPFRSEPLTPAPLGRRFFAGFLDAYVGGLPAIPLNAYFGSVLDARNRLDLLMAQVPAVLLFLVYYTILEGRWGCGAGKAVLSLRVIDETETVPGMRRAFLRAAMFVLPAQIVNMILGYVALPAPGRPGTGTGDLTSAFLALASLACSFAILATLFSTARRRNGYLALHDRATKTRVVIRPGALQVRQSAPRAKAGDHPLAAGGERVGPYTIAAGLQARSRVEPVLTAGYDDRLHRGVWIQLLPAGTPPLPAARRDLGRPGRSRWLSGRRAGDECWDAYELVDGRPFLEAAGTPQPWSRVRHWLSDLADEIAAGTKDGSLPPLTMDRIWIGTDDRARLLDFKPAHPAHPVHPTHPPQAFLYGLAAGALRGVDPEIARAEALAMPLPIPARTLLDALRNGSMASLDAVRAQAEAQLRHPPSVTPRRRAMQMAVCALVPVFLPVVVTGAIFLLQRSRTIDPEAYALRACTGQLSGLEKREKSGQTLTAEQREQRELVEIYIAEHLQDAVEESAIIARRFPVVNRVQGEHELAARAIANHPTRSPEQVQKADAAVAKLIAGQTSSLGRLATPKAQWTLTLVMIAFGSAFVGVLAAIGSLVARGGFTYRTFNMALVRRDGRQASRIRALVRVLVAWSPIPVMCYLVISGPSPTGVGPGRLLAETAALLVFVAGAAWAIRHPSRGLQDRIAGTWIVPR